ncbi:hypothetical protein LQZ18_11010 [Lachnospiraceae bacterium ZAX-1]
MMSGNTCGIGEYNCSRSRVKALEREMGRGTDEVFEPIDKGDGVYYLDLQAAMDAPGGPSSKEVLIPFLEKGEFKNLEMDCSHIPHWLDAQLQILSMLALAEETVTGFCVTITPEVIQ